MALVPAAASNGNGISASCGNGNGNGTSGGFGNSNGNGNGQKMAVKYLILGLMTTLWGKLSIMGQMIILVK